jgi:hypothetical protein
MVSTILLCQRRFGRRRRRPNHRRAPRPPKLRHQQPKPARNSVNQDRVPFLHFVRFLEKGIYSEGLEEARGGCADGDGIGDGVRPFPGDRDVCSVCAEEILGVGTLLDGACGGMVRLTAATFPPTTNPFFLKVSLLRTAGSVGSATMVPAVSFPKVPGSLGS